MGKTRTIKPGNSEHKRIVMNQLIEKYQYRLEPAEIYELMMTGSYIFRSEGLVYSDLVEALGNPEFIVPNNCTVEFMVPK